MPRLTASCLHDKICNLQSFVTLRHNGVVDVNLSAVDGHDGWSKIGLEQIVSTIGGLVRGLAQSEE
jgi:hypothetical protein